MFFFSNGLRLWLWIRNLRLPSRLSGPKVWSWAAIYLDQTYPATAASPKEEARNRGEGGDKEKETHFQFLLLMICKAPLYSQLQPC